MSLKIGAIFSARRWYGSSTESQYDVDGAQKYDRAALLLSDRERFGKSLAEQLGGDTSGRVLEIGAGTGIVSAALKGKIEHVVHTDIAQAPLTILRRRLGSAAVVRADFLELPFPDQSFDTVVGVGTYRYVEGADQTRFWEEMHRVTRPDGQVVLAQFYPRGFRLRGTDLAQEALDAQEFFEPGEQREYVAKAHFGPLAISSGVYRSITFSRLTTSQPVADPIPSGSPSYQV